MEKLERMLGNKFNAEMHRLRELYVSLNFRILKLEKKLGMNGIEV